MARQSARRKISTTTENTETDSSTATASKKKPKKPKNPEWYELPQYGRRLRDDLVEVQSSHIAVNLRGTSGSGKSYVGHKFLAMYPGEPLYEPAFGRKRQAPMAYRLPGDLYVLGRYRASGGGCDGFHPDEVQGLVEHYLAKGHVFFEALTTSASMHRWLRTASDFTGGPFVFAFLDTPVERCISNIHLRRANRGDDPDKPLNTDAIYSHHGTVAHARRRMGELGADVVDIDHQNSFEEVRDLFLGLGWDPTND